VDRGAARERAGCGAFCCWEALEQRTKLNKQKFFSHEHVKCDKIE